MLFKFKNVPTFPEFGLYFQILLFFWTFLFIKESWKMWHGFHKNMKQFSTAELDDSVVLNISNNKKYFLSSKLE